MHKFTKGYIVFLLLTIATTIISCKPKDTTQSNENVISTNGDIRYAKGFQIIDFDNYTKVIINNPWANDKSKPFSTYYLYKEESDDIPTDGGTPIKVPIQSVIVNTFSYFEFLKQLDELDKVVATTDVARIYNPTILNNIANGTIADLGDPFNPNIEKTLMLKADAVINSAYVQQDSFSERVQKTGLPVIYSLEWMETSPLARAEWIKLIAEFVDKRGKASSLFDDIENRYNDYIDIAKGIKEKPTILSGDNFQDTWYVPGGDSFNAHYFNDAGANYYYKNDKTNGSIGLDIESILVQFGDADVWINCEANSYTELINKDRKYNLLKAVKNKRVFNNRNRTTATGGNDYFESAIANPDLILRDIIKALHPDMFQDNQFTYLKPLK